MHIAHNSEFCLSALQDLCLHLLDGVKQIGTCKEEMKSCLTEVVGVSFPIFVAHSIKLCVPFPGIYMKKVEVVLFLLDASFWLRIPFAAFLGDKELASRCPWRKPGES